MYKHKNNKLAGKKTINVKKVLYGAIAIVSVVVVFSTIQTSTIGAKLQYLEEKESVLEKETSMMEGELTGTDSLSKISENADKLEFTKPQKIVYSSKTAEVGLNLR